jgi:2-polyprenyl-3-methyl-5-hydroxy-6-metoxy-1,4-benzoquinol methylase
MINDAIVAGGAGFDNYYGNSRDRLLSLFRADKPTHALEIGCGTGANLFALKRRFPTLTTYGVEIRADAAEIARTNRYVDHVEVCDITQPAERYEKGMFDVIVMSHVLEHFARPDEVLAAAVSWLRDDGKMLIALPNVRHASVLKGLVWDGDFEYRDLGILDRTHLRFYTRKSAVRLLEESGLTVQSIQPDVVGLKSGWLSRWSAGLMDEFAAQAYNFLVAKNR